MVSVTQSWPILGAALPSLFAVVVAFSSTLLGVPAFGPREPLTLAEAAGLRDRAAILRLVRRGVDPNAPAHVRRDVLRSPEYTMTPLEAAIASRRADIMLFLTQLGAVIDEKNYSVFWCFAQVAGDDEVIAFLEARRPGADPSDCSSVSTAWGPDL